MDNLQYEIVSEGVQVFGFGGFKPYYKWIIFNIENKLSKLVSHIVLNLIING